MHVSPSARNQFPWNAQPLPIQEDRGAILWWSCRCGWSQWGWPHRNLLDRVSFVWRSRSTFICISLGRREINLLWCPPCDLSSATISFVMRLSGNRCRSVGLS